MYNNDKTKKALTMTKITMIREKRFNNGGKYKIPVQSSTYFLVSLFISAPGSLQGLQGFVEVYRTRR